jgi:hypothetical protein
MCGQLLALQLQLKTVCLSTFPFTELCFCAGNENKLTRKIALLKIAMRFGMYLFNGELDQTKEFIITCLLTVPLD